MIRSILIFLVFSLVSQAAGYSVFSAGNPVGESFRPVSGESRGMGGVACALADERNTSLVNPANLALMKMPSFAVLYSQEIYTAGEAGGLGVTLSRSAWPLLVFVYPFKNAGNGSLAFRELSKSDFDFVSGNPGGAEQSFRGTGGRFAMQGGFARTWSRRLRTGFQIGRFVGFEKRTRLVLFESDSLADRADTTSWHSAGNFAGLGIGVTHRNLAFGLAAEIPFGNDLSETKSITISAPWGWPVASQDKVSLSETLPPQIHGGVSYSPNRQWRAGFDLSLSLWSLFERPGFSSELQNEIFAALGGAWVRNPESEFSWLDRIPLRGGVFVHQWPNSKVRETGFSAGAGLPFKDNSGLFDISFEYSRRSSAEVSGFAENSFKLTGTVSGGNFWPASKK